MKCSKLLLALCFAAQSGCFFGLPLSIEPTGANTYHVVIVERYTGSLGWSSGQAQRTAELNKAVSYCNGLGKKMQELDPRHPDKPGPPSYFWADIHFSCADK